MCCLLELNFLLLFCKQKKDLKHRNLIKPFDVVLYLYQNPLMWSGAYKLNSMIMGLVTKPFDAVSFTCSCVSQYIIALVAAGL